MSDTTTELERLRADLEVFERYGLPKFAIAVQDKIAMLGLQAHRRIAKIWRIGRNLS